MIDKMHTVLHVIYFIGKEFGVTFLSLFFGKRRFLRSGFFSVDHLLFQSLALGPHRSSLQGRRADESKREGAKSKRN
jgi:hypothetical protein